MTNEYPRAYEAYLKGMVRTNRTPEIIGYKAWHSAWFAGKCPDCGRSADICVNTMSKCSISPNNTKEVS